MAQSKDNPGSLFRPDEYRNPFKDRTARRVGDLLTVVISEKVSSVYAASTQTSKSDSNSIGTKLNFNLIDDIFAPLLNNADSSGEGSGRTTHTSDVAARMAVTVIEVRNPTTLVVEGRRKVVTNRDTQTLVLRGVVRLDDVASDNTVLSENVAEMELELHGEGAIQDRQRKGLITQLLDWLF